MNSKLFYAALGLAGIVCIWLVIQQGGELLPDLGSDGISQLVYMGIWGALIGAAVLSRPIGFGETIKQITAWIGIFLVLMTGYTYRYELQDVAARVSGGIIPGSPISENSLNGRSQVTLFKDVSGHFVANAKANNSSVNFLVDTGASQIVLTHEDAGAAGIDTDNLAYTIRVSTANGMTTAARAKLSELRIGNISRSNIGVMVSRKGDLDTSLLGMRFVESLWGFEIRGDRLILTD